MKSFIAIAVSLLIVGQVAAQLRCFECDDCTSPPSRSKVCGTGVEDPIEEGNPTEPPPISPTPMPFSLFNFNFVKQNDQSTYKCFYVHREGSDERVSVHRGCVEATDDEEKTCREANEGRDPAKCKLCDEDECNDLGKSSTFSSSILLVLSSFIVAIKLY